MNGSSAALQQDKLNYDEIFNRSFERVLGSGAYNSEFISDLYDAFLASSPVIAAKFAGTDMSAQRTMLHDSLLTLVDFNRTREPDTRLQQLARIHSRGDRDVPPALYTTWLDSLVNALRKHDPQFDSDVELAWRLALTPGICFMSFAY